MVQEDFRVTVLDSMLMFEPMSQNAWSAVEEMQVPGYMWLGGGFVVEWQVSLQLIHDLQMHGMIVAQDILDN